MGRWHEKRLRREAAERAQVERAEQAKALEAMPATVTLDTGPWSSALQASFATSPTAWANRPRNWFQLGQREPMSMNGEAIAAVYACQSLIAESVAPVRLRHVRRESGVLVELEESATARLLAQPNYYQSGLEFMLYAMLALLSDGNAYAWSERDSVGRVVALHPVAPSYVQIRRVRETGDYFYHAPISAWDMLDRPLVIPARDVWHLRGRTRHDPLVGLSPLVATYYVQVMQGEMQSTSAEFFLNKARPGGILTTENNLTSQQAASYLEAWERGAREGFAGKTAVLDRGLNYHDLTMSAVDAAFVEQYRLTVEEVARAYGVPGWMIGLGDPSYSNAETMDRAFHARTLRYYFDLIERSLGKFLRLGYGQALDFATEERLAKVDTQQQLEGYRTAVQGGLLTPNEARQRLGLPPRPEGDELLVQQQMVPLSRALEEPASGAGGGAPGENEGPDGKFAPKPVPIREARA